MKKEYSESEARVKAEAYCSLAEHCRAEVMAKLSQWGMSPEITEKIVGYLEKERFVDELRYAKAFVRDKYRFNQWGRIKIVQALRFKQITSADITKALEEIDEEEYLAVLGSLLQKKQRTVKASNDYERKGKLIRFAASRGYEMEEILFCLKRVGYGDFE